MAVAMSFYPVGGGESGYVAADPADTNIFYAGSYGGYITRFDHATRQQRDINVWPEYPVGQSAADLKERFQWTTPIVFSPVDPKTLYTSSQHLFKTTNQGQTWTVMSPDLTRHDPSTLGPSGGPITHDQTGVETYGTIFTVAPSRLDGNLIWTGSDDGLVYVTRDGGKNWSNVTPPDLGPLTRISLIEASPHDRAIAYVAANRYQAADRGAYVYKTTDFGKTWTKIVNGIAPGDFARAIREDTVRPGLLYLGTELSFYVSLDGGSHWQPFRLNLPVTPVHDIAVEKNDLVIATHGRGFYVLDDIGPLRQLHPEVTQSSAWLFNPADATRTARRVLIDYYLAGPDADLKLEVLDTSGTVIRAFQAGDAERRCVAADDEEGPPAPARTVPAKKGLNRLILGHARSSFARFSRPHHVSGQCGRSTGSSRPLQDPVDRGWYYADGGLFDLPRPAPECVPTLISSSSFVLPANFRTSSARLTIRLRGFAGSNRRSPTGLSAPTAAM